MRAAHKAIVVLGLATTVAGQLGLASLAWPQSSPKSKTQAPKPEEAGLLEESIATDGMRRHFFMHLPPNYQEGEHLPLVIMLHGGLGTPLQIRQETKLDALADRSRFIAVYPEGVDRHWNDGRNVEHANNFNDIKFISDLIEHMERRWGVNPSQVYVGGISNGGFFAQYLALLLPDKIAAVCSVAATLPTLIYSTRQPQKPVSVLYILGMNDPLVPFKGGSIQYKTFKDRGSVISAQEATQFWVRGNRCSPQPAQSLELADRDPSDGTRVKYALFTGGPGQAEVEVYGIEGGGHTWPGGNSQLPAKLVGATCRDFDATEAMWQFFQRHHLGFN